MEVNLWLAEIVWNTELKKKNIVFKISLHYVIIELSHNGTFSEKIKYNYLLSAVTQSYN